MSIQSEIERIKDNVAGAYSAVEDKGGTVPEAAVSDNLAEAIRSIPEEKGGSATAPSNYPLIDGGTYTNLDDLLSKTPFKLDDMTDRGAMVFMQLKNVILPLPNPFPSGFLLSAPMCVLMHGYGTSVDIGEYFSIAFEIIGGSYATSWLKGLDMRVGRNSHDILSVELITE